MKRFILYLLSFVIVVFIGLWIFIGVSSEPLPQASGTTQDAETLTDRMLETINKPAYDSIQLIEWSFPRGHHFVWEKSLNRVTASWGEHRVVFYPDDLSGTAYVSDREVTDQVQKSDLIQQAWALFANDSFWLVAPYKVRDPGTTRSLVTTERGKGLLVTYTSGGVTPGDSYLWILDEEGQPIAWKMWVGILPVKGLEFTWEGVERHQFAWFAPLHAGPMGFDVNLVIHRIE